MSTELAKVGSGATGLTVYDRVDPIEWINTAGKVYALTGAGGCKSESDGKLLAMVCMSRKMDIFQIAAIWHLIDGKLVKKAGTILADFRRAGGSHRWIVDGTDGKSASLELTDPKGNRILYTFTIEKATAAGYVKPGSQWAKRPDQMLRARCITDAVNMLMPEVCGDDFEVAADDEPAQQNEQPTAKPAAVTIPSPVISRPSTITFPVAAQPVREPGDESEHRESGCIDSTPESAAPTASADVVPFDVPGETPAATAPPPHQQTATLMEIEAVVRQAGLSVPQLLGSLNAKNGTAFTQLDQLSNEAALKLLTNLRAAVAAKAAKELAAK